MATSSLVKFVKSTSAGLEGRDLLQASVDQLLGVSPDVAAVLRSELRIQTIFDLATSRVFQRALNIADPEGRIPVEYRAHGFVPADALRPDPRDPGSAAGLADQGLEQLALPTETAAPALKAALDVETIRDLAVWAPFQTAKGLFDETFGLVEGGPRHPEALDPERPSDLVVRMGDAPDEKAFYHSTFLLDTDLSDGDSTEAPAPAAAPAAGAAVAGDAGPTPLLDLGQEGQIDLFATALLEPGFDRAAEGVRVTTEQTWYNQGVTLGQLLHSVALAPGEVTRLAFTDWSRRGQGARADSDAQAEDLAYDDSLQRSVAEVTNAVADETQWGSTRTETQSHASQSSGSGNFFARLLGFGSSTSRSHQDSVTTNVSRTDSMRHLSTSMNRNINTATHQHANAKRRSRTAVIEETRQREDEKLSTRVVANYNHMHALTIQYYEVVQNYRVESRARQYTRCLFVPLKVLDFSDPYVILKHRRILEAVALNDTVKKALSEADEKSWRQGHTVTLVDAKGEKLHEVTFTDPVLAKIDFDLGGSGIIDGIQLLFRDGTHWNSGSWSWYWWWWYRNELEGDSQGTKTGSVFENTKVPVSLISRVLYDPDYSRVGDELKLTYNFVKGNQTDKYVQTITLTGDSYGYEALRVETSKKDATEVIQHMQDNALYYSQAIWYAMGEAEWMKALLTATYKGKPVAPTLDPTPIAFLGNYVAFPWHFEDERQKLDWLLATKLLDRDFWLWMSKKGYTDATDAVKEEYLDEHDEPQGDQGLVLTSVPMSTGGVFAEAVPGRFNGAEKLDITRFWNWQDSPIQIMPPEIQKLTAGSRAAADWLSNLKASGLEPDAIHVYLPDQQAEIESAATSADATMGSLLRTLTMANMFRDMSNAAATTALAQQSIQTAAKGANDAGQQELKNTQVAADLYTEVGEAAAKAAMMVAAPEAGVAGMAGGAGSASSAGALLNAAGKLDAGGSAGGGAPAAPSAQGASKPAGAAAAGGAPAAGGSNQLSTLKTLIGKFL